MTPTGRFGQDAQKFFESVYRETPPWEIGAAQPDIVEAAVEQARTKSTSLPDEVRQRLEFVVADASQPSHLGRTFGSIVDSGFLHLFDPLELDRIVPDLREALRPAGRLYLLAFAHEFEIPRSPRAVSAEEIHTRFRAELGWRDLALRSGEFQNQIAAVPATVACVERVE